jgi:hypothetical protein
MNLTVCGGGLAGCCSPLLVNEGNGAIKVVHPCLKLPIVVRVAVHIENGGFFRDRRSWDQSLLVPTSIGGMLPPRGDLSGECAYCSSCTFLLVIIIGGGDGTMGAFCLTTIEGLALDVV